MRATLRVVFLAAGVLVIGLWTTAPTGAQSDTTTWKESGMEMRVYDIKALFTRIPIYNFAHVKGTDLAAMNSGGGGGGGGGGALYSESTTTESATFGDPNYGGVAGDQAKHLQDLIEHAVKVKEPWESAGGRGTIGFAISRGLMFVYTIEEGHKQIATLLHQLIPGDKRNVFIDIQVVDLDRAALGDNTVGFMAAADKDKAALKKAVRKVLFSAMLSGTDGQILSSEKGAQQNFVVSAIPVVADHSLGFTPTMDTTEEGLAAKVQASLSSDETKATFDFRLLLSRQVGIYQAKLEGVASYRTAEAVIDLPRIVRDAQAGTLLLPLDTPTIVAGGTVPQSLLTGLEADTAQTEIFYLVTVRSPVPAPAKK
jgi:hypothetical protein